MKDYHLICDDVVARAYLAWRVGNDFFVEDLCGPSCISNERKIIKSKKIVLPSSLDLNGWKLYADIVPETLDVYTPSEDVLTYDIERNTLHESNWYPIEMCWIDAESMGPYVEHKPTHWLPIPTPEQL